MNTDLDAPRWDLGTIYPSIQSPELASALRKAGRLTRALVRYMDDHNMRADAKAPRSAAAARAILDGYLSRANEVLALTQAVGGYARLTVATDAFNGPARAMLSQIEMQTLPLQQALTRFEGWTRGLAPVLERAIALGGETAAHAFHLRETLAESKYLMSDREEELASALSLSGARAWSKLQGTLTSQLTVRFKRHGEEQTLSMPALINIAQHDPDQAIRRQAYETELQAWDGVREPLAAALNGVKGAASVLHRRRGRPSDEHAALAQSRIDSATLEAMLGAMRDALPMFRRYFRAKSRLLGHSGGLPWWDLFAPIATHERRYSWTDAREMIFAEFGRFSPRMARLAGRAFDERWIDAQQRPGKRAGAFCSGIALRQESRILCNFDGSLDQVSTVAHEIGHAFHNECLFGRPVLRTSTPMTLAETASIFCETIVGEAALAGAADDAERLAILETDLIGKSQVIVDIYARYLFETEVFRRRAEAELSADDFCDIMLTAQASAYGDGLDEAHRHKYMWTWKPHYYYAGLSFYNWPYAFGLLFGTGLYAAYRQRGPDFVGDYERLLASTGEASAADLAKGFGINIRRRKFWADSLAMIGGRIDQYCALAAARDPHA